MLPPKALVRPFRPRHDHRVLGWSSTKAVVALRSKYVPDLQDRKLQLALSKWSAGDPMTAAIKV